MWNQWNILDKNYQRPEIGLIGGPTWPKKWASAADIVHISESSPNTHINKIDEYRGNVLTQFSITWILAYLQAQNGPQIGPIFYKTKKVIPLRL